jgi:hypothetical protein
MMHVGVMQAEHVRLILSESTSGLNRTKVSVSHGSVWPPDTAIQAPDVTV